MYEQRFTLLLAHPGEHFPVRRFKVPVDSVQLGLSLRCQAQKGDSRILGVLEPQNVAFFSQPLDQSGDAAFNDAHAMGNALGRQIAFVSEKAEAAQLGIRQIELLGLSLNAILAALVELENKILELVNLVIRNGIVISARFVHIVNYRRRFLIVKATEIDGCAARQLLPDTL